MTTDTTPKPIEWELEICWHGMVSDGDGCRLAERHEDVEFADVELQLRLPDTGQVETIFERNDLSVETSTYVFDLLESFFPHASTNVWPE